MNYLSNKPSKTQAEVKITDSEDKFEIVANQNTGIKVIGKNINSLIYTEVGDYDIRINDDSVRFF